MASSPPDHSPLYAPLYPSRSAILILPQRQIPAIFQLPSLLIGLLLPQPFHLYPGPLVGRMRERSPDFVEGKLYVSYWTTMLHLHHLPAIHQNERHTRRIAQAITRQVLQHIGFEEALRRGFRRSPQLILLVANGKSEISAETLRISFTPLELR
ncbi:hypothetical protein BASA84_001103 [Batrachochytrium salamandrivorans]|nr:hypothetical protein BASA84_001103 [Batrachochytrium salamandrivorans]